jgi:hypothetical protein
MAKPGVARSDLGTPRFAKSHPSYRAPEPKICQMEDCTDVVLAKNLCVRHYWRLRRHGDPLGRK